jgi:hypothetical protein
MYPHPLGWRTALAVAALFLVAPALLAQQPAGGEAEDSRAGAPPLSRPLAVLHTHGVTASCRLVAPVTLREPVQVQFSVRNDLDVPITFDLGWQQEERLIIDISRPAGPRLQGLKVSPSGAGRLGTIALRPHTMYSNNLILNEWYDFDRPGRYVVSIWVFTQVHDADGTLIPASLDASVKITVQPRNEVRLRQKCEELARIATSPRNSGASLREASQAAKLLGFVNDSACTGAMAEVLPVEYVGHFVVPGLKRLATAEAVGALIDCMALPERSRLTIPSCRDALRDLGSSVNDQVLRDKIHAALAK